MASRHYKYNSSCSIMRIWSSGLLLRRVLPGTRPVTTTLGTHPGDNNLWESVTSIAGNPQRKSRTRHIPGDIYRWASHLSTGSFTVTDCYDAMVAAGGLLLSWPAWAGGDQSSWRRRGRHRHRVVMSWGLRPAGP